MQITMLNLSREIRHRGLQDEPVHILEDLKFTTPVAILGYGNEEAPSSVKLSGWEAPKLIIRGSKFAELSIVNCKFDELHIQGIDTSETVLLQSDSIGKVTLGHITADTLKINSPSKLEIANADVMRTKVTVGSSSLITLKGTFANGIVDIENDGEIAPNHHILKMERIANVNLLLNIKLDKLTLIGNFSDVQIKTKQDPIKNLEFSIFSAKNRLLFNRLRLDKSEGTLSLVESDLSNVQFYECDLNAKFFLIHHCLLGDCQSFETNWPIEPNLLHSTETDDTSNTVFESLSSSNEELIRQRISYFRQLKNIYENGGDVLRSSQYRMHELAELERICDSWTDKVPLWVGYVASKHGTNWIIPIGWMLSLSFIFTVISILILPSACSATDCNIAYNITTSINPVHKISDYTYLKNIETVAIPWWFVWLDLALRAANSYLIFQTVRSFRKFIK